MQQGLGYNVLATDTSNRVGLDVKELNVLVKKSKRTSVIGTQRNEKGSQLESGAQGKLILNDVSFLVKSGEFVALMGGSGSGKTTLLNVLSQRLNHTNKKLSFNGSIEYFVGGVSSRERPSAIRNAYLLQNDIFLPGLTVLETLMFQADLRLPSEVNRQEKLHLVNTLLELLEIKHTKNQIILDFASHAVYLSGGEQRRISIAIQLLNKPSILFLDEPTSGLDASTSLKLIQILKKLASPEFGVTLIVSIHQPRPEIMFLFDKICLLAKGGRMVYYGSVIEIGAYIPQLDRWMSEPLPKTDDFFLLLMHMSFKDSSTEEAEYLSSQRIDKLVDFWRSHYKTDANRCKLTVKEVKQQNVLNTKLFLKDQCKIGYLQEIIVLTKRSWLITLRDKSSLVAFVIIPPIYAAILGWMFFKPTPDLSGIRQITSSMYVSLEVLCFAYMFLELERFWFADGTFFYRERKEISTSVPGFIISRRLSKLFLEDLPSSVTFAAILYFMWGLRTTNDEGHGDASYFFNFLAVCILVELLGMALSFFCFAVSPDLLLSNLIINVFYQVQNMSCGYFVNAKEMPVYVRWLKYCAFMWYAFGALTANQYTNWYGNCPYEHSDYRCKEYSGDHQLEVLGFPKGWVAEPIGILACWFVGLLIVGGVVCYFKNMDSAMAKTKQNKGFNKRSNIENEEKDSEKYTDSFDTHVKTGVDIVMENITLSLTRHRYNILRKRNSERTLLDNVSGVFKGNRVNVIMGPSGGGKTTLLNFLAERLPRNTSFNSSGLIELNGVREITPKELSEISAYVTQHDSCLIPTLTVRETLYYQAKLRLPKKEQRNIYEIVNSYIRKVGLVDCADTLVGSESLIGISGGEKRRVSIAIQLLSRPKVLFLDEPTSGLDSKTAMVIIELFDKLAKEENATIIMTVHQPSEDMFSIFETVLLLARGGHVLYNGKTENTKSYLAEVGYPVPENKNVADYVLDLTTQMLGEDETSAASRVEELISKWLYKKKEMVGVAKNPIDILKFKRLGCPAYISLSTTTSRQFVTSIRAIDVLVARAGQVIALGAVLALFYSPLKRNEAGIDNRLGLVQEVLNFYFVGLVNNISLYPTERNIFYQEYRDKIYGVGVFSLGYLFNELPVEIISCLIFAALVVFPPGLPRNPGMFFSMFYTSFVALNCGESLGILFNSLFTHIGIATNVLSLLLMIAIFMGGTMATQLPDFFQGVNYVNPLRYGTALCAQLGFEGQSFSCNTPDCKGKSGDSILKSYGLESNVGPFIGALTACLIIYRLIGVISVYIRVRYFI